VKVSIVIPAYNEASTIGNIVRSVIGEGVVIVVDDGSIDETASIASNEGAIIVKHQVNCGYDAALQSGFEKSESMDMDVVVTFDADGQHSANMIRLFIDPIISGEADMVLGVRKKTARISEFIFNIYSNIRYDVSDLLCGFKSYNMSLYRKHGCFDSYNSIGTELALFGLCKKVPIETVVVNVNDNIRKPAFGNILTANVKILKALIKSLLRDVWYGCR